MLHSRSVSSSIASGMESVNKTKMPRQSCTRQLVCQLRAYPPSINNDNTQQQQQQQQQEQEQRHQVHRLRASLYQHMPKYCRPP
mmetsp:Transcript_13085/g.23337  ORF Transcript_13085/g.23337 Transcript_13085/m.23337 type:complete len:84 (-) Transcript_13085:653-904(-)